MLIFFIVFVVIDVDDIDETDEAVAVVGGVDVTVVLVFFFFLWTGSGEVAYLFTMLALRLPAFHRHHHGLILVVQCMGYCLE